MKKLIFIFALGMAFCSSILAESITVTTTVSASADKVGSSDQPGLLFKFDLPEELQKARIDLAYLRFKVETDTTEQTFGLLVRPMLEPWSSGSKLSTVSDSAASPYHVNFGRVSLKSGAGKVEMTQVVKAWQSGELSNLGLLVYPAETEAALKPTNLPAGGVAELEVFYTAPITIKADSTSLK